MSDSSPSKPAMTAQQEKFTSTKGSGLSDYKSYVVGNSSWGYFIKYEFIMLLFSNLHGLLGFGLRSIAYRWLFKSTAGKPAIGKSTLIRNPGAITLGKKPLIDDHVSLDASGKGSEIQIGDFVCIGRFSTIAAKGGKIKFDDAVNIGSYCRIASQSDVHIGESALIAAYCYIGPGNHQLGDEKTPLISKGMENKGGVEIGPHTWIGTRATILDGVKIGARAIVGAHSLVREDVPEGAIVIGTPAKIIGSVDDREKSA